MRLFEIDKETQHTSMLNKIHSINVSNDDFIARNANSIKDYNFKTFPRCQNLS